VRKNAAIENGVTADVHRLRAYVTLFLRVQRNVFETAIEETWGGAGTWKRPSVVNHNSFWQLDSFIFSLPTTILRSNIAGGHLELTPQVRRQHFP
jgi:hypothetical protein